MFRADRTERHGRDRRKAAAASTAGLTQPPDDVERSDRERQRGTCAPLVSTLIPTLVTTLVPTLVTVDSRDLPAPSACPTLKVLAVLQVEVEASLQRTLLAGPALAKLRKDTG